LDYQLFVALMLPSPFVLSALHTKFNEATQLWRKAQDRFENALGPARAARLRSELSFLTSEKFNEAF
jgi:hypothetical protein